MLGLLATLFSLFIKTAIMFLISLIPAVLVITILSKVFEVISKCEHKFILFMIIAGIIWILDKIF